MPYLKEGEEGEIELCLLLNDNFHNAIICKSWNDPTRDWSTQFVDLVLLDKNCWFLAFEGPELLILLK